MQLPFPDEKHHLLYHIHNINNDDGAEERSHICFIKLYDDDFVGDRDDTIPIIREMDDNCLVKSKQATSTRNGWASRPTCVLSRRHARAI